MGFRKLCLGGAGEDIFGETYSARIASLDQSNRYLLMKMMREYVQWHEKNGRFYDNYDYDKKKLQVLSGLKWVWGLAGVGFAGIVVNPNFTSKFGAYYLRKISVVSFALIFYHFGRKKQDYHMLNMMLKMHDYFPLEVKRAMRDKDYRHLALFDWENPGRKLFDDVTGKSLS